MWAYDSVFDRCANGQQLKCLTVVDEFTHKCLAIDVAGSIRSGRVIEVLSRLVSIHGSPKYLRSDNVLRAKASPLADEQYAGSRCRRHCEAKESSPPSIQRSSATIETLADHNEHKIRLSKTTVFTAPKGGDHPRETQPAQGFFKFVHRHGHKEFLCVAGVFVPEALIVIDRADRRICLVQCGHRRRGFLGLTIKETFDGLIRDTLRLQQTLNGSLDLYAAVVPRKIGQAVQGFLAWAAEPIWLAQSAQAQLLYWPLRGPVCLPCIRPKENGDRQADQVKDDSIRKRNGG